MSDAVDPNKQASRYSQADLEKWAGYEGSSTVRVMNQIRKDAGYGDYVEFGADDVTASETKREQEEIDVKNLALPSTSTVLHIIGGAGEEAAVGAGLIGAALVVEVVATGKEIIAGDKVGEAVQRDQMHMAMLANLDLPQGYKNDEMSRLQSKYTDGWASGAQKMAEKGMGADKSKMALVQIHADQGANASVKMLDAGADRRTFFANNPGAAVRYATDPAFKAGFDALAWAHGKGGSEYANAKSALGARDSAYVQAHVRISV